MQHSFTSYRERGKTDQDGLDGGEAQGPLLVSPQLPTTTTFPQTHGRWGGKQVGRTSENSVTLSPTLIQISTVISGGITNRMYGLKFNLQSAVYGNLKYESNYLRYKSNNTRNMKIENIVGRPPHPARQQQGQLIWKIQKKRLTINIVGWHFSQLV